MIPANHLKRVPGELAKSAIIAIIAALIVRLSLPDLPGFIVLTMISGFVGFFIFRHQYQEDQRLWEHHPERWSLYPELAAILLMVNMLATCAYLELDPFSAGTKTFFVLCLLFVEGTIVLGNFFFQSQKATKS